MNKLYLTITLFFSVLALTFLTSCKGSAGKKAATETLEFIEKKAASKAASSVEREAGQVERAVEENADDAYRSTRSSRPSRPRHHSSYGDDDPQFRNLTNSLRALRSKPPRMRFLLFKLAFCHVLTDMIV